jgi:hypothetical protein
MPGLRSQATDFKSLIISLGVQSIAGNDPKPRRNLVKPWREYGGFGVTIGKKA